MGSCCCRRSPGDTYDDLVGQPAPSRPEYDGDGMPVKTSPVSGIRRRVNLTPLDVAKLLEEKEAPSRCNML